MEKLDIFGKNFVTKIFESSNFLSNKISHAPCTNSLESGEAKEAKANSTSPQKFLILSNSVLFYYKTKHSEYNRSN